MTAEVVPRPMSSELQHLMAVLEELPRCTKSQRATIQAALPVLEEIVRGGETAESKTSEEAEAKLEERNQETEALKRELAEARSTIAALKAHAAHEAQLARARRSLRNPDESARAEFELRWHAVQHAMAPLLRLSFAPDDRQVGKELYGRLVQTTHALHEHFLVWLYSRENT